MASTYSTNLALELPGTGDQAGTWGTTTNRNLGTLIEQAISGYVSQAITDGADTVITIPNGATGVARNMAIVCTGALTAGRNLVVPANIKLYLITNSTTGGFSVTVKVAAQTGIAVPPNGRMWLVCNGTDIIDATNYMSSLALGTALPLASGGTASTTAAGARTNLGVTATGADTTYCFRSNNLSDVTAATARTNLGLVAIASSGSATDLTAGTLPAARMVALTGDVTNTVNTVATTIASQAVTYAKMQNISATSRVLGRITAGAGSTEELTAANVSTILGLATIATSASATDLTAGTLPAARMVALTGDVTNTVNTVATTIAAAAVTLAKMANLAANSIIGNNTGSGATPLALTTAQVKTLLAIASGDVSGLGTLATLSAAPAGTLTGATLASGVTASSLTSVAAACTVGGTEIGFRRVIAGSVTTGTIATADSGKCIYATGGVTIPNSGFVQGDIISIYNNSGSSITLTLSPTTKWWNGADATGTRTLAARQLCNVLYIGVTEIVLTGSGIT